MFMKMCWEYATLLVWGTFNRESGSVIYVHVNVRSIERHLRFGHRIDSLRVRIMRIHGVCNYVLVLMCLLCQCCARPS